MKSFLRNTLLGGLFVVVPVTVVLIVLARAVSGVRAALEPFAAALPFEAEFPGLLAVLMLVLLAFAAGLILQVRPVRAWATATTDRLAERFPVVGLLRGFQGGLTETGAQRPIQAALVEIEEALVPAFVISELQDGRCVVFVPAVPSAHQGAVYVLTPERVHPIDASVPQVVRCVRHWGVGLGELVQTMRTPASFSTSPHR